MQKLDPEMKKKVRKECGNLRFSATQILRETDFQQKQVQKLRLKEKLKN